MYSWEIFVTSILEFFFTSYVIVRRVHLMFRLLLRVNRELLVSFISEHLLIQEYYGDHSFFILSKRQSAVLHIIVKWIVLDGDNRVGTDVTY